MTEQKLTDENKNVILADTQDMFKAMVSTALANSDTVEDYAKNLGMGDAMKEKTVAYVKTLLNEPKS